MRYLHAATTASARFICQLYDGPAGGFHFFRGLLLVLLWLKALCLGVMAGLVMSVLALEDVYAAAPPGFLLAIFFGALGLGWLCACHVGAARLLRQRMQTATAC